MAATTNKDQLCQTLCDLLDEGDDIHRTVAAQALGHMGYAEAVPNLIKALLDEDEDVRTDAATALKELNDPRAAEPLMQNLLGDPCPEVKLAAIDALTSLRHAELAPWLRRMMKGKDQEIAWDENEFYDTGWDDWVDVQVKAIKSIAEFGDEDAVGEIVEAIDDEYAQDLSEVGFAALAKLGKSGIEALAKYASATDSRLRRRAVTVLGGLEGVVASTALSKALQDDAADVRVAAGRAIATRDRQDKRLEMLLVDKLPEVRAAFVPVCGQFHPSRLAAMLFERFAPVQAAVLQVLITHPDTIDEMGLKGRVIEILNAADAEPAALAVEALMALSPGDMEGLVGDKLLDGDTALEVRLGAIRALTTSRSAASLDTLKTVLGDDQRQIRLAAMTAVAKRSADAETWPNDAGEVLLAALRGEIVLAPEVADDVEADEQRPDSEAEAEQQAEVAETIEMAQSLQPLPSEHAGEAEIETVPNSTLASVLDAEAVIDDEPPSEAEEVELSDDDRAYLDLTHQRPRRKVVAHDTGIAPHQDVRRFAARLLGDFFNEDVAVGLAQALAQNDKELALAAFDSLAHLGAALPAYPTVVVDALLQVSGAQDADIRFGVSKALVHAGGEAAIGRMREFLQDDSSFVRVEAIRGLALNGQVDEQMEARLGDELPAVRFAAADALLAVSGSGVVPRLVDFAFEFEAYHVRAVAKLLRANHAETARAAFLEVLKDSERKRLWKPAIEALEELGRAEISAALAA